IWTLRDGPLVVSCHRTLDRALSYARQAEELAEGNDDLNRVVVVLFGGLSFALPGIMASHMPTVPVIGVPAYSGSINGGDFDATTGVYNLPPGTVVGGAPQHSYESPSLDKAVLIAEKILNTSNQQANVSGPEDILEKLTGLLGRKKLGVPHSSSSVPEENAVNLNVSDRPERLVAWNNASYLALQCVLPGKEGSSDERTGEFANTIWELDLTDNTLYFGRPENAALFLARVMGVASPGLRERLRQYRVKEQESTAAKYGAERSVTMDDFM
ncbi:AIR carboxylase family protein, partial [Candidatus Woesearchaeota archaeon]|nr:AIR carboxylase family protein [Candidatus Woesearchaeota archaeon]